VTRPRIAVIGGGLAGLVAADRLLGSGFPVTVFEKWPEAGGLVGTLTVGGTPLERFYHHLFTTDVDYLDFAREFGLEQEIDWLPSKMGFFTGGRLWDFGTPASLLKFSPSGSRDVSSSSCRPCVSATTPTGGRWKGRRPPGG